MIEKHYSNYDFINTETFVLILFLFIILTIFGIYFFYFFKSMFWINAPSISSFDSQLNFMKNNLKINQNSKILDLGCGTGKAMRFFANNFDSICFWYDINILSVLIWKILNFITFQKNIFLQYWDFTKQKIDWFDYIYIYLMPFQMSAIEDRIRKYKSKNCKIISNSFTFTKHKPSETIKNWKSTIYIYI